MIQTIVGKTRSGRAPISPDNDGRAATVEDFVAAMEEESDADLSHSWNGTGKPGPHP